MNTIHHLFEWLLRASWEGSVLALVVFAAQWMLGRRLATQWRCYLWLMVAFRFVLPFSLPSPLSVFNFGARRPLSQKQTPPAGFRNPAPAQFEAPAASFSTTVMPEGVDPVRSKMAMGKLASLYSSPLRAFWQALPLIWLVGAVALALWISVGLAGLARRLRFAVLIEDVGLNDLLERCAREMGVRRRVLLVESEAVTSPALHGIWRPRLILPLGLSQSLGADQLRFVFLHEMAHVRRCDIAIGWIITGIQILHWFNPVAWLAIRSVRIERELACDELVLGQAGLNQRKPYGETLLRLAQEVGRHTLAPGTVGILQNGRSLRRRMKSIADFTPSSSPAIWSALVFAMVAVIGLTDSMAVSGVGAEALIEQPGAQKPARHMDFRLTIDLLDGSRVVGKSPDDNFRFRSDVLGEFKLPLQKLRNIECPPNTKLAKLTTVSADLLRAEFAMKGVSVETSFGNLELAVGLIRSIRVSTMGAVGRPMDGLIALWSGDGNPVDSIRENNGVTKNVSFTDGVAGQAFLFAPDNQPWGTYCGVQISDKPAYELMHSLTVECWVRPRGHSAYVIFFRGDHRPGLDPYSLSMDGNQNLVFNVCDSNGVSASVRTPVDLGGWIHVAGVLDDIAGTMSLYTNGVVAAESITNVRPFGKLLEDESPGIGIGNVNDGGNNFPFAGEIDEVGLYDRALSQDEVNAIYAEHQADASVRAEPLPTRSNQGVPTAVRFKFF